MYLLVPTSAPHAGQMALPFGSFRASFTPSRDARHPAELHLHCVQTGAQLATLTGEEAESTWNDVLDAGDPVKQVDAALRQVDAEEKERQEREPSPSSKGGPGTIPDGGPGPFQPNPGGPNPRPAL